MSHPSQPPHPSAAVLAPGDLLAGRFRIVRFIARGGMGEVYEAEDLTLHDRVALKTLRPEAADDERNVRRFRREVQLARQITHPNVCRIYDIFEHRPSAPGGRAPLVFVSMELLEGETLADRIARTGAMPVTDVLPIVDQMADALAAAHAAGVVHRDFKSANVMLLPPAAPGRPARTVVTDFGLALRSQPRPRMDDSATTATTYMLGTPDYMAPEQVRGDAITPASDVYAFGVVLYELLTGVRPFTADTAIETALRRLSDPPAPPTTHVPGLPEPWERTILQCLALDPAARPSDVRGLVRDLRGERRTGATSDWKAYALAGGSAVAVLALMAYLYRPAPAPSTSSGATATAPAAAAPAPRPPRRSVAVLGFRNLSGRADVAWLGTAFAEMLSTELAAGEALRTVDGDLVARTAADLRLDETDTFASGTLQKLQGRLASDLIVFGTYVAVGPRANENLRLDVRLQDAASGEVLTAFSETAPEADLPALVARAGARLRERLGATGRDADAVAARAALPTHPEAARLYAEGLARLREFDALAARDRLEQAAALQPGAPGVHAALADTWAALGYDERASRAAERARELSTALPRRQQLEVDATWREMRAEWPEAIAAARELVERAPDDVEAVVRLAHLQTAAGDARDALATLDAYRVIAPAATDPRLELEEAAAAETLADFPRMQAAARRAAERGAAQGARLMVARAGLLEGTALYRTGKLDQAEARLQEARATYDQVGDRDGAARAMNSLAAVVTDRGDQRRGMTIYEDALKVARATGNQNLTARLLNNLAISYRRAGDLRRSLALNREALAIRRDIGDRTNLAVSLNNIGNVLIDMGDLAGASGQYEEAARIHRDIGDRRGLARALYNAGVALRLQGEVRRSLAVNEEALEIRRGIDDPASLATSLFGVAEAAALLGDEAKAKGLYDQALETNRRLKAQRPIGYTLYALGEMAYRTGEVATAKARHEEAMAIRAEIGERGTVAESQIALARIALAQDRPADAEALARTALGMFTEQKAADNEAIARATLARAQVALGRRADAITQARAAVKAVAGSQSLMARFEVLVAAAHVEAVAGSPASRAALANAVSAIETRARDAGLAWHRREAARALATLKGQAG